MTNKKKKVNNDTKSNVFNRGIKRETGKKTTVPSKAPKKSDK